MIIVSVGAGLGNQMYEYSFYKYLTKLFPDKEIKVDIKYAFPKAHNGIEVFDIFGLSAPIASFDEVKKLVGFYPLNGEGYKKNNIVLKIIKKLNLHPKTLLIQDDFTEYYESFFNLNPDKSYYLLGPFANHKYFIEIEDEIKHLFEFPKIMDNRNLIYANDIKEANSVSIHIRKGDYVNEGIELTSKEFYDQAIAIIKIKVNNPKFFIFTDDINYARELFPDKENFTVVEGNTGKNSFRDMQLMSICKHNITANSTFSFWGAFLNKNLKKIVIAPDLPFTGLRNTFTCDEWIKI